MAITMLKPRLQASNTNKLRVLEPKAGTTPRTRGRAWMETRREVMLRDKYTCACCGLVRIDHEVDHIVPLEQQGEDEQRNMQLLCSGPDGCHARKTAAETIARAKGWGG